MTAMAELISLFGSEALQNVAKKYVCLIFFINSYDIYLSLYRYKRRIVSSHLKEGCDLGRVCKELGERAGAGEQPPPCLVTKEGADFLKRLLNLDHQERVTASLALKDNFLKDVPIPK